MMMKTVGMMIFLSTVLIIIVLATGFVEGANIVVDQGGGGDFTTLQEAVDFANPGDTLEIRSGLYNGSVIIDKNLKIVGEGIEQTTIRINETTGFLVEANNVAISHISFNGIIVDEKQKGIYVNGSSGFEIQNSKFSNLTWGVYIRDSYSPNIEGNIFQNNMRGLYIEDSDMSKVTKNTLMHNGGGVELVRSEKIWIYNNTVSFNNGNGIYLYLSNWCTVANNTLDLNYGYGLYVLGSNYNYISNNSLSNSLFSTIYLWNANHNVIQENSLKDTENGIYLKDSKDNTISRNILSSTVTPLRFWNSENNILENNTVEHFDGSFFMNETPPHIINATAISRTRVELLFSKDVNPTTVRKELFTIHSYKIMETNAYGDVVILVVEDLGSVPPEILLVDTGIEDLYGNLLPSTSITLQDRIPVHITSAETSSKGIILQWSRTVKASSLQPSMFSISSSPAASVVSLEHSDRTTALALNRSLRDDEKPGLAMDGGAEDVYGFASLAYSTVCSDGISPRITSVTTVTTRQIRVVFSEMLSPLSKDHFWVSGYNVSSISHNDYVVVITVEPEYPPYYTPTIHINEGIEDIAGNRFPPVSSVFSTDGIPNVPPNLLSPNVNPQNPSEGENIVISVVYSDKDNEAPVWVRGRITGPTERTVDLQWDQGDYAQGVIASASVSGLEAGAYVISFSCFDGKNVQVVQSAISITVLKQERRNVSLDTNTPVIMINPSSSREGFVAFTVKNVGDVDFSTLVQSSIPSTWRPSMQSAYFLEKNTEYRGTLRFTVPREIPGGIYNHSLTFTPMGEGNSGVLHFTVRVLRGEPGKITIDVVDPMRGQQTELLVTVENTGDGVLHGSTLLIFEGGKSIANLEIPPIPPGENRTIRIPWTPLMKGSTLLSATVSSDMESLSSFRTISVADVPLRFSLFAPERLPVLIAGIIISSIFWFVALVQVVKYYQRKRRSEYVI